MINKSVKTPIIYPGGKTSLLPHIMSMLPPHSSTLDLFGGGGSFILLDKFEFGVYNDVNHFAVGFFRCLQDSKKSVELKERLQATPYSRELYVDSEIKKGVEYDEVDRAYRWFVSCSLGFTHEYDNRSFRVGQPGSPESFKRHIDNLGNVIEKLRSIVIENLDFRKAMQLYGGYENTLVFADPPYITTADASLRYDNMFTLQDHIDLIELLSNTKAQVVLCGYPSDLYDSLLRPPVWEKKEILRTAGVGNKAYTSKGRDNRTEVIWTKFREVGLFKGVL